MEVNVKLGFMARSKLILVLAQDITMPIRHFVLRSVHGLCSLSVTFSLLSLSSLFGSCS